MLKHNLESRYASLASLDLHNVMLSILFNFDVKIKKKRPLARLAELPLES